MDATDQIPAHAPQNSYTRELLVRYSDEDCNRHVTHARYAEYFEDVKEALAADHAAPEQLRLVASRGMQRIVISYIAEARALDVCEIKVGSSCENALDLWIYKMNDSSNSPSLVTRGRVYTGGGERLTADGSEMIGTQIKASL